MMTDSAFYVGGIDVGSLTVKMVILDGKKQIVSSVIQRSGHDSAKIGAQVLAECLGKCELGAEALSYIVATGYGRVNVPFAGRVLSEITCHAKGIHHIVPSARVIIDIGGQDSKAIASDSNGRVLQFRLNDKCAAGTGRFLEVMASALDIDLEEMGEMAVRATQRPPISSVCTVFAESEIIGMMAHGTPKDCIVAGLCDAISTRIYSMVLMVAAGRSGDFVLTGGVAKNQGIVKMLSEKIGKPLIVPPEPQLTGALGAALAALESV